MDEAARDALIPDKSVRIREKLARLLLGIDLTPNAPGPARSAPPPRPAADRRAPSAVSGFRRWWAMAAKVITFSHIIAERIAAALAGAWTKARIFSL